MIYNALFKGFVLFSALAFSSGLQSPKPTSHQFRKNENPTESPGTLSRREIFNTGLMGLAVLGASNPALAFENKISTKYDDRPKRKGPKPADLGVLSRKDMAGEEYPGLKHCGSAPNCFCSTEDAEDDPDHSILAWTWPKDLGDDKEKAFAQLAEIINAYQPGQSNVDGGGFKIVTNDPVKGYIYTQFESLKNGYIDDFELAYIGGMGERTVQVRSSSRIGYLDFGVNAKRLNYIAQELRAKGWDAAGVDYKLYQNYAIQNELV